MCNGYELHMSMWKPSVGHSNALTQWWSEHRNYKKYCFSTDMLLLSQLSSTQGGKIYESCVTLQITGTISK